ncbi:MAG: response regulator transcription factor [Proteobacteria bacterium]|nr:response regulator transcription factor [Pseudomonadota bacterium]
MKILIADDHALFRDGLSMNLEKLAPHAVISQAANFTQALKIAAAEPKLNLIIIDLDMPDMKWEDGLRELQKAAPNSRIVIISASDENKNVKKALELGVSGYISKRMDTKLLNSALKLIIDGGTYLPPSVMEAGNSVENLGRRTNGKHLTARQSEVLSYVAEGMSNKQIAYEMGVSEATVKLHINALLRAVGATNRTQAVVIAQKMGII